MAALGILLLSSMLGELFLTGVRLLKAERPPGSAAPASPAGRWSAVGQMSARAREMGFR
jgi:hypothetical protein